MKLNNKGQSLVLFVLLLPIIFMIIALVVQVSLLEISKKEYEDNVKEAVSYGLEHLDDSDVQNKLVRLLDENIEGQKQVSVSNGKVRIKVSGKIDGMFSSLFEDIYRIEITYIGYLDDGKKRIEKD